MILRELVRFELAYQFRRRSIWITFVGVLALMLQLARESFLDGARTGGYRFDSPFVIAGMTVIGSMIALAFIAAVAGDAATRDERLRLAPLMYTTSIGKSRYLGGRFLAAFAVNALLLASMPLSVLLLAGSGAIEPALLGPFRAEAYATAYLWVGVPSVFVVTALLFSAAVLARNALASYAAAAALFLSTLFTNDFVAKQKGLWDLGKQLDPFAFTVMSELARLWTPGEKNQLLVSAQASLVANRLLWLGIAVAALALAWWRFDFAHHVPRARRWRGAPRRQTSPSSAAEAGTDGAGRTAWVPVPAVRCRFDLASRLGQTLAIALRSFREIATSWGSVLAVAVAVLLAVTGPELLEHIGVPRLATTGQVVQVLTSPQDFFSFIAPLLTVLYAGELVWRERDTRLAALTDVTPVPDWVPLLGKFAGLGLALVALQGLMLLAGLAMQLGMGYADIDPLLYAKTLFGLELADHLLFAALALAVHALVNQKYLGHLLAIGIFAFSTFGEAMGVEHKLLLFGASPDWSYSELRGFGDSLRPWLWFKAYWAGWALLLLLLARLAWVRGPGRGFGDRLRLARLRMRERPAAWLGATGLALVLGAGSFTFFNTNVLNRFAGAADRMQWRADYERRFARYEVLPQPTLTATRLRVELYPSRRQARIDGSYRLLNQSGQAIDTIHLARAAEVETSAIRMDRGFVAQAIDDDFRHDIYRLERPLQPGEALKLDFRIHYGRRGFSNAGSVGAVVGNGTHFEQDWLPAIGFQAGRLLSADGERRKHGLPPRVVLPRLEDVAARMVTRGSERIAFDAVIGTEPGQLAIAPGSLRRRFRRSGREYFHYATEQPIPNLFAIYSADYHVHEARWRHVRIEILHHPGHTANLARMTRSVQASLEQFTTRFGPYPHPQLRLVESPGFGVGLTSHPINIRYSEGYALLDPDADWRRVDFPFAVMAHEVAHQWWGNQLTPAKVQGAPLLSESLAWYSAIGVVERAHGTEHLDRFLDIMRDEFLNPRARADVPLLRADDWFQAYRRGPFSMFALRQTMGEPRVDGALRRLLRAHTNGAPPRATSLDLYAGLEAASPPAVRDLLADLFQRNTFWELSTRRATTRRLDGGSWEVILDVSARKLAVDEAGIETERPMDDLIEIGVYAPAVEGESGKTLYLRRHRIHAGTQRIRVLVSGQPARAGLDPRKLLIDTAWRDNTTGVVADVAARDAAARLAARPASPTGPRPPR